MKIAAICNDDYANFMYCQVKAMRMAGVDIEGYKATQSVYNYPKQCRISRITMMRNIKADVIIVFHSHLECLRHIDTTGKRLIFVHTGTRFRKQHADIIEQTQHHTNVIALPEFAKHLPDAHYVVGCIDDEGIRPRPAQGNRFGHYPSNAIVKGTATVQRVAKLAGVKLYTSDTRLPYAEHLDRIASNDIIVEMLAPKQEQHDYGSFGMQALEAAAMGKVVITNNLTGQELYQRTYGDCELEIANDEAQLFDKLQTWKHGDTKAKGESTLAWYKAKHGLAATGERWANIIRS